jgi:hypothetical protein
MQASTVPAAPPPAAELAVALHAWVAVRDARRPVVAEVLVAGPSAAAQRVRRPVAVVDASRTEAAAMVAKPSQAVARCAQRVATAARPPKVEVRCARQRAATPTMAAFPQSAELMVRVRPPADRAAKFAQQREATSTAGSSSLRMELSADRRAAGSTRCSGDDSETA